MEQTQSSSSSGLWRDAKFRWLIFTVAIVGVFETLSLSGIHLPPRLAAPLFAGIILAIGYRNLAKGLTALAQLNFRSINLLMVMAAVGAFYLGQYEEAAVVIVLFALGERLEEFGVERSKSALRSLVERVPKTGTVKGRGEVAVGEIATDEVLVVKPGETIVLDGEIVTGASSVDESTITGEPLPKDKRPGDLVFAGTLNMQGYLEAKVTRVAADSTLARILDITFQATASKAETQAFIEKFSSYYTPSILLLAVFLATIPPFAFGLSFNDWLLRALTLLVISCPCALVIATPISIYSAIGNASARGILVKGGRHIEAIGRVRTIALDKTRTLTIGKPVVTDVIPFGTTSREHLLACAAGIESYSEHPLAQSIVEGARAEGVTPHGAENFAAVSGKGAKADCLVCYDRHHCIGKLKFVIEEHAVQQSIAEVVDRLQEVGKTSIVISSDREVKGIIALTDAIKPESKDVIAALHRLGVDTAMFTGDHITPATVVARKLDISIVKAELLPEDKAREVAALSETSGPVAMVGDGVNDAPALAVASVGIAMGAAGSDAAIEAASIAILNDRLDRIPFLIALGRRTIATIRTTTGLAVATKLVVIGLAVAGLSNLALAIFADVGVTVVVILMSLRLLQFDPEL